MALAVKALFFDVFGRLVDWRNSIAREAEALLKPLGYTLDWLAFADAWRGEYQGAMEEVRVGAPQAPLPAGAGVERKYFPDGRSRAAQRISLGCDSGRGNRR